MFVEPEERRKTDMRNLIFAFYILSTRVSTK